MEITYYGHACFAVKIQGKCLLFDPYITPNPLASHIQLKDIKPDYIFVSHGHEDHHVDVPELFRQTRAPVISNWEVCTWFEGKGISKTHRMNHGGILTFPFGTVKYVYAYHSSSLPDGSYGGNPGGFIIDSPEGSFYYSGDTSLMMDMKLIGEKRSFKFAAFPIGNLVTMGIEDAAQAAAFVKVKNVLGLHYDTFPPIKIDHKAARSHFQKAGLSLHLPAIGKPFSL